MLSEAELQMLARAAAVIKDGGVIIAPAEGVYGFSCAFDQEPALRRILQIKERAADKGLITICADVASALSLVDRARIPDATLSLMQRLWPGPHTFVLPCREGVAGLLTGFRPSIALRVTGFPLLQELCRHAGCPLVSTSVNLSGRAPLKDLPAVEAQFSALVDYIIKAPCQGLPGPSSIYDGLTGRLLRQGGAL